MEFKKDTLAEFPLVFPVSYVDKPFDNPTNDPAGGPKKVVGIPLASVPKSHRLVSLKPFFEQYRTRPEFRAGFTKHRTPESFIQYIMRYKADQQTVIFHSRVAFFWHWYEVVFDYHPAGPDLAAAGSCEFRAVHISKEDITKRLVDETKLIVFEGQE